MTPPTETHVPGTPVLLRAETLDDVLAAMTLEEKAAQLVALWLVAGDGAEVAPMQHELLGPVPDVAAYVAHGLGQLTRPLGSRAGDVTASRHTLAALQHRIRAASRFGIPALVHEECLTGLQVYGAATYPTPLAWGATWHPDLVRAMAAAIGDSMRRIGVHLGLAPVVDVVRDPRWGRVEECIAEDPYLVAIVATAYVSGLQSAGVGATLKHFAGYSGSRAGRNLAPVHAGPRELREVFLAPFEMVVKEAHPAAVMHSYAEVDGVPVAASAELLTGLLRNRWGFDGTVVADYFGITFLETLHGVAGTPGDAAALALRAGVDVELPTGVAYLQPLIDRVRRGDVDEALVDRAVRRVLAQKVRLGVAADGPAIDAVDLDPPGARAIARALAEQSVILLDNDGVLPLRGRSVAVVGPNADSDRALMGNYSFTNHVDTPPGTPLGIAVPTVLTALRDELPGATIAVAEGCGVRDDDRSGLAAAVEAARGADVCVAVVGDRAGLFGRGTVGEGCDTDSLELPGVQRQLVEALIGSGTPVVLVLITGRPYAVGWAVGRVAAIVQAFFPGEEGGAAIAGVLSGRVNPGGRLPVSMPRSAGAQPYSYRHPRLGAATFISAADPTPVFPFGYGRSYTTFVHSDLSVSADQVAVDGEVRVGCTVRNTGRRDGTDVVQLYASDPVASITRPVRALVGWARVELAAGGAARVEFSLPADRLAFVGPDLRWLVEPGEIVLTVAPDCAAPGLAASVTLTGEPRVAGEDRALRTGVAITPL